jgi:hypothetical protein
MKALEKLSVSLLTAVFAVVVFAPGMWAQSKFKTLHAFNQVNKRGEGPGASLVFDATGNLYGTTGLGGAHGGGIPRGWPDLRQCRESLQHNLSGWDCSRWHGLQANAQLGQKLERERAL